MALTLPVHTHEPNLTRLELRRRPKNVVETLITGGAADAAGVQVGDRLISVNGEPIRDIVDWKFQTAGERVTLEWERNDAPYSVTLRKGYDEDLGVIFGDDLFDGIHICKNKCVFCFCTSSQRACAPACISRTTIFVCRFCTEIMSR